jgi:enamine deaminase RidA (YjgF/YER057c/UK114 family)
VEVATWPTRWLLTPTCRARLGHTHQLFEWATCCTSLPRRALIQQPARCPDGGFEAECRQVFANIERALKASGSDLGHVVKTTVFYVDLQELQTINKVYGDVFPHDPPARSAAIVGLAGGRRISIDVIAILAKPA